MTKLKLPSANRIKTGTDRIVSFEVPEFYLFDYRELVVCSPEKMDVELSKPSKPRTTGPGSQGNHFNGHIRQICGETGNEFEDVKLYIKRQAFRRGLRYKTNKKGEIVYSLNDGEPLPISEADMTIEECGWCIDEAHVLAFFLNIVLIESEEAVCAR